MLVIKAGIHKMLVRIANRVDPGCGQIASLRKYFQFYAQNFCLSKPTGMYMFKQAKTIFKGFR